MVQTVVVLDDLDRADSSSLTALEFFANELKGRPLWILATTRPFASLTEARRARLETFESATAADRVLLRPLTSSEVAEYLRLNDPTHRYSAAEIQRRFSETGGNPLLLQQLDRRRIPAGGEGTTPPVLPILDAPAQGALDVAAVLGSEFSFGLLLSASGEEEEHLAEEVETLVSRGVLFERPGELLEFPEDRLREEAYGRLGDQRRRLLHRRAGEALESTGSSDPRRVFALARHFYLGREARRSAQYNRIAAQFADQSLAPSVAREHLTRALESYRELPIADRSLEWELVLELARVTYDLGQLEDAARILGEFLDRDSPEVLFSPTVRATLEVFLAQALVARGDLTSAAALSEKILAAPDLDEEPLLRIGAHHQLGQTLYYQGDYENALVQYTEEIRLAKDLGSERVTSHARLWRAGILGMTGDYGYRDLRGARGRGGAGPARLRPGVGPGAPLPGEHARRRALARLSGRSDGRARRGDPVRGEGPGPAARRLGPLPPGRAAPESGQLDAAAEHVGPATEILGRIGDRTGLCMSLKVRGQIATANGSYRPGRRRPARGASGHRGASPGDHRGGRPPSPGPARILAPRPRGSEVDRRRARSAEPPGASGGPGRRVRPAQGRARVRSFRRPLVPRLVEEFGISLSVECP